VRVLPLVLLALSACTSALVEPPPSPPSTLQVSQEAGCFSAGDCASGEICVDPRYPVCGNQPACEGSVQCGCECLEACTATSCKGDEVCGASGCCEPRSCAVDAECGSANVRCVTGRCRRRGACSLPPP
jgi:hypothetical protein